MAAAFLAVGVQAGVVAEGLVSQYAFDGDTSDSAGGYDLSNNGATLTTDRFGNADSAYYFDGSDYMISSSGGVTGNGARTVAFWVKASSSSYNDIAVGLGTISGGNNQAWGINVNSATEVDVYGLNYTYDEYVTVDTDIYNEEWRHLAVTYDGNLSINVYVDGALAGSVERTEGEAYATTAGLIVGNWANMDRALVGAVDDVQVYSRALSQEEISQVIPEPAVVTLIGLFGVGALVGRRLFPM